MAKNFKTKDLEQQRQQIKALSDEKLKDLDVMVVRDAKSLNQILKLIRNSKHKNEN